MKLGIDFGTSNCAAGILRDGKIEQIPLDSQSHYLQSAIYTPDRALLPRIVLDYLTPESKRLYQQKRGLELARANRLIEEEGFRPSEFLYLGQAAFDEYMQHPEEGYFLKSPKSFLGVLGLKSEQINLFIDLTTIMLGEIKRRCEKQLGAKVTQAVIGRPVNFLGMNARESNQQATGIIRQAAELVGFEQIEFLFEPEAAGHHFAHGQEQSREILVVDIGGGTSDFSLMKVDPDGCSQALAHRGMRIGGNDFDIALAIEKIMPEFGLGEINSKGRPTPAPLFWDAMSINDIPAQRRFYDPNTRRTLQELLRDMPVDSKFQRMLTIWDNKRSFELVRRAELCKIELSDTSSSSLVIKDELALEIAREHWWQASDSILGKIHTLISELLTEQASVPDCLYLVGGAASSPMFVEALRGWLPGIPIERGNNLGGVVSGLTLATRELLPGPLTCH
ncbi:molecular chaperone [Dongshaea marina]|uniref:molecular chaperone n=1 Tax=Dongshaea marina TaxID=2047966 RepID=UPI00131F0CAC|nr:molecular chaperone [Dongshaea marina]